MRLIITGGLGHIGSGLLNNINSFKNLKEIVVFDYALKNKKNILFNLKIKPRVTFIGQDILKFDLNKIIKSRDIIIHLAAITNAVESFKIKKKLIRNNFLSTKKIVDICKKKQIKCIFLSSTSVYGSSEKIMFEDDNKNLNPQSPYAECKLKEERYILNSAKKNKMKFVILRFGTIYGVSSGMRFHTAVNKFCYQAAFNKPLTVWKTALNQKRPYLDLNDAVKCIKFIISKNLFNNNIFNVLTNNIDLRSLLSIISKYKRIKIKLVSNKIMNQFSYEASNKKISDLGFRSTGKLNIQIKKTLNLFKGVVK